MAAALALTYFVAGSISNPIVRMIKIVDRLAQYDFKFDKTDKTVEYLKRNDEIGQFANALAVMQKNIAALVKDLKGKFQILAESSESLSASSEEIAASSNEVAKAIQQVAAGASEQAGHLQEITSLIENITQNLDRVYDELGKVKANSEESSKMAEAGKKQLDSLVAAINGVRDAFKVVVEKLEILKGSVGQVEEILEVINGIAEQTNLLALNAAIEAARAGDAGRGFAVVAEEVRKLAEQSTASSDKIRSLLGSIITETNEVVSTSEDMNERISHQIEDVTKTVKSFDSILESVEAIVPMIEAAYREVDGTVKSKDVVLERVESISAVSQETSSSAQEISASAEELSASTEEIAANAQQVMEVAKKIEEQVERFKI